MIILRQSKKRGHFDYGWLDTYHTFSFSDYQDPKNTHFRSLRVINEDQVQAGQGFPTHSHQDMEIITYVLEGALEHKDSMGNTSIIRPGDVQRMSAGTGVTHSEYNPSETEPVHLLQIWIFPAPKGLTPSYEQRSFGIQGKTDRLRLIASSHGDQGSVTVHQDVLVFDCLLQKGKTVSHSLKPERGAWIQVMKGQIKLNHHTLKEGDGASAENEKNLSLTAEKETEFFLFDLNSVAKEARVR